MTVIAADTSRRSINFLNCVFTTGLPRDRAPLVQLTSRSATQRSILSGYDASSIGIRDGTATLSYERHKSLQPSRSAIETHSRRCIIGAGCYCASGAATCIRSLPANRIDRPIDSEDVYLVGGYCEGLTFFSLCATHSLKRELAGELARGWDPDQRRSRSALCADFPLPIKVVWRTLAGSASVLIHTVEAP